MLAAACDSGSHDVVGEYSLCWVDLPENSRLCRELREGATLAFESPTVVAAGFNDTVIAIEACGPNGREHYSVDRQGEPAGNWNAIGPVADADIASVRSGEPALWPEMSLRRPQLEREFCGVSQ